MRRGNHIGDRNWSKQPLFAPRRRSYLGWVMLLMAVFVGAVFMLIPGLASALLTMLTP